MPLRTNGARGAKSGVKIAPLRVPAVAAVEGDDAGEEDARVLCFRADASAMKFAPAGLAQPFRAGSPMLDLNTKMMHIFPQKKTK